MNGCALILLHIKRAFDQIMRGVDDKNTEDCPDYNIYVNNYMILQHSFPLINFNVLVNHYINSFFKKRMSLPSDLCSNIVYILNCPTCNARYI